MKGKLVNSITKWNLKSYKQTDSGKQHWKRSITMTYLKDIKVRSSKVYNAGTNNNCWHKSYFKKGTPEATLIVTISLLTKSWHVLNLCLFCWKLGSKLSLSTTVKVSFDIHGTFIGFQCFFPISSWMLFLISIYPFVFLSSLIQKNEVNYFAAVFLLRGKTLTQYLRKGDHSPFFASFIINACGFWKGSIPVNPFNEHSLSSFLTSVWFTPAFKCKFSQDLMWNHSS